MQTARFSHNRLEAYGVVREALVRGDALAKRMPRGYAKLADQLRRALLGAFLQLAEAASRDGEDRRNRFRCARAEAGEAAAAIDAAEALGLVRTAVMEHVVVLLDRFGAMVTAMCHLGRPLKRATRTSASARPSRHAPATHRQRRQRRQAPADARAKRGSPKARRGRLVAERRGGPQVPA